MENMIWDGEKSKEGKKVLLSLEIQVSNKRVPFLLPLIVPFYSLKLCPLSSNKGMNQVLHTSRNLSRKKKILSSFWSPGEWERWDPETQKGKSYELSRIPWKLHLISALLKLPEKDLI